MDLGPHCSINANRPTIFTSPLTILLYFFFLFPGSAFSAFDTKLLPSDGTVNDKFGYAVSVSGDTVAIGSERDDDQENDSGSAYIFGRDQGGPGMWGQVAKLTAADAAAGDLFSNTLALSGDTVVVGALFNDNLAANVGAAYVFDRNQGGTDNWGQTKKLTPSDGAAEDHFGNAVAISGDIIAVGSWWNDSNGSSSGAVYLFARDQGGSDNWGQVKKITPDDGAAYDSFGASVGLSGDILAIGASNDDDNAFNSGSVYIFYRNQGGPDNWGFIRKVTTKDGAMYDNFGRYLSINGYTLVVGVPNDDDAGDQSGASYVFERNHGGADNWGQVKKLTAGDAAAGDEFGISVSVSGGIVVVGARGDDILGESSGSVYLFKRNEGGPDNWGEAGTMIAGDGETGDYFGHSVWLNQDTLVSGSFGDDDLGNGSGSAYIFTIYSLQEPPVIDDIAYSRCVFKLDSTPLSAVAHDPYGGSLTYEWTALDGGSIAGSGAGVTFQPPVGEISPDPYRIELKVTSSVTGLSTSERIALQVTVTLAGDFDADGDVDGSDLSHLADDPLLVDLASLADNFGKTNFDCYRSPPDIIQIGISETIVPLPVGIETYPVTFSFDFYDPDMDIDMLHITFFKPDGTSTSNAEPFWQETAAGTYSDRRIIDSTYEEGRYRIEVELTDDEGLSSGVHSVSFEVSGTAPKPLEITGVSPLSGKPGDTVLITGVGFDSQEPWKNDVRFAALSSADVVSATESQMEVVVPQGAMSGPLVLTNALGATQSADTFSVDATITISPQSSRMEVGDTIDFICILSGASANRIDWFVNGETSPDPTLGAISASGSYTAPAEVPDTVPVMIRCTSSDDPTLFSEATVDIIAPPPLPGEGTVTAKTGAEMTSESGETTIVIPPQALSADTTVTVETLSLESVTPLPSGSQVLAAASFGPESTVLSEPVTVTFELKSWVEPGTVLPLEEQGPAALNEFGPASGTGTVVVDETGLKATGAIDHFQTYRVVETGSLTLQSFNDLLQQDFDIIAAEGMPLLEGLSVPVLIKPRFGPGNGPGPFLTEFTYRVETEAHLSRNDFTLGPIMQPSADGWELGTVLNIPVLSDYGEKDDPVDFSLSFNIPDYGYIDLPFTVTWLDELIIGRNQPLDPAIVDALGALQLGPDEDGFVRLYLPVARPDPYRFSAVEIREGGTLYLRWFDRVRWLDPVIFEVTGDVKIQGGELATWGNPGWDGHNGDEDREDTGKPGLWHGGQGGEGGAWWEIVDEIYCSNPFGYCIDIHRYGQTGENGDYFGGGGGKGGDAWDKGSWAAAVYHAYGAARSAYTIFQSGGTAYWAYYDLISESYAVYEEGVKISENNENELKSIGLGGKGGRPNALRDVSLFRPPQGGGGGGGSGKLEISLAPDREGAGGGGGGGGGSNLQLIVGGRVIINEGGIISGRGGSGGQGGNGEGGDFFDDHAAPGGGGGGGSGSAIHIVALKGVVNNGRIIGPGGVGGLSGELPGRYSFPMLTSGAINWLADQGIFSAADIENLRALIGKYYFPPNDFRLDVYRALGRATNNEEWEAISDAANGGIHPILFSEAFGGCGAAGILRVDGPFQGPIPYDMDYYLGPIVGENVLIVTDNDSWAKSVYLGMEGWSTASQFENRIRLKYNEPLGVPSIDTYSPPFAETPIIGKRVTISQRSVNTIPIEIYSTYLQDHYSLHPWQQIHAFYFPGLGDTDGDNLKDGLEAHLGTTVDDTDSDNDGLDDGEEVFVYATDPLDSDTDGDGFSDDVEVIAGSDPLDMNSVPGEMPSVWILDNADPDYANPPFDDELNAFLPDGTNIFSKIGGINISQTISAKRALAVNPNGRAAWVVEWASDELSKYTIDGNSPVVLTGKNFKAVDVGSNSENVYTLLGGTISGDGIIVYDQQGTFLDQNLTVGGVDLVVDESHDSVWIVGDRITRLDLDLNEKTGFPLVPNPITWSALSVDYASDGTAWVSEGKTSQDTGTQRLLHIGLDGTILHTVDLMFQPYCVRVDRADGSVWIAGNTGLHKYIVSTDQLTQIDASPGRSVAVNHYDNRIWFSTDSSGVKSYSKSGALLTTISGFSSDHKWVGVRK